MSRYPHAVWDQVDATGLDHPITPDLFVLHIAVTDSADIYGPQLGPGGTVAHLYVDYDGNTRQHVDTGMRSYACGALNNRAIAQETAGYGDKPLTPKQVEATALNFACAVVYDRVPNRIATVDNVTGLGWHRLGVTGNFGKYDPEDMTTWSTAQTGVSMSRAFGKTCPGDPVIRQIPEIYEKAQTHIKGETMMCSPVAGYVSQEFKGATVHAGIDIATGGKASPVYAMFDGTIRNIVRGRKRGQSARIGTVVAPGRSGDGARVYNPDGAAQVYIHVGVLRSLKNGDRVKRGQLIGHVNLSGITTGHHLHLEMWDKRGNPINPRIAFNARGMTPGEKPAASAATAGTPYYARQIDGVRGAYQIKAEQQFLADRDHYDRVIDGKDGYYTQLAWQKYLAPRWYKRAIDGKAGKYTVMALQEWLKASGHYDRVIDGVPGRYTNMAVQKMLASNYRK